VKPSPVKVMIVEDETGIRLTLGQILEEEGYRVTSLERGSEALALIRHERFNVIITDLCLPDISGMEIIELAQELDPEVTVIITTAYASMETAVKAVNQGTYAYFIKPINPDELKINIANALKQQRLSQENKKLVDSLQKSNKLLVQANEELQNEIGQRLQIETELKSSEERLSIIFELAPDGYYLNDLKGNLVDGNIAIQKMVGYKKHELYGKNLFKLNLVPPRYMPLLAANLAKNLMGQPTGPDELWLNRKDGTQVPVEITSVPVTIHDKTLVLGIARDISSRKQTERDLRESEERYRDLFENANDLIQSVAPDGRFIYVNKMWLETLKYHAAEMDDINLWDIIHPDSIPHCRAVFQEIMTTGKTQNEVEAVFIAKDGGEVAVEGSVNCRCTDGKIVATRGIFRNITHRKQMEKALRDSEERYRSLVNNVSVGILRSLPGPPGRALEVNPALEEITGYSRQELLSMDIINLYVNPETRTAAFNEMAITNDRITWDFEWRKKDGSQIVVRNQMITVRDEDGSILYIDSIVDDITEHKRMSEALKESEKKYRTLVENATDFIFMVDQELRVLSINRVAARRIGKSPRTLNNKTIHEIFPTDTTKKFAENLQLAFATGKTIMVEHKITVGNSEFWESASLNPIHDDQGKVIAVMGLSRDITEQKQMQKELQTKNDMLDAQNEELQAQSEELLSQQRELLEKTEAVAQANQLKSDFLANMSHELRTPLNVIIGFSQLMIDGATGRINKEQRECLDSVLDSSQHLLSLINGVLDLSKIESGAVEIKPERVALDSIIESVSRAMMPILNQKQLTLDVDIEPDLVPVFANEDKLEQVLLNLIDNAAKFTPNGGKLRIKAATDSKWCRVVVADNGIGIRKEDQARVFEPFCQLEHQDTTTEGSTGLGLALVKQIVENYGGTIIVDSEYGQGSRFIFTIPLTNGYQRKKNRRNLKREHQDTACRG